MVLGWGGGFTPASGLPEDEQSAHTQIHTNIQWYSDIQQDGCCCTLPTLRLILNPSGWACQKTLSEQGRTASYWFH